ncbi:D-amino acid aminotransferase [Hydrogenophaga sp.]|uniref:D-amino acid aminotransferase n=1 Tax=Hydrogenophaga sp. TaxID=1904254 RepID=UPI002724BA11|nr:D-amino acid aminotransferase [Hydrogenophaga sp.]MDO9435703.1 D-amino acid aminotransferase [Hydrogenophaga sp.]
MTEQTVYLNGEWTPLAEARVPVLDRGFLFGDGIYEVVPVFSRVPFRWAEHHRRLVRSLGKLRMADPMDAAQWASLVAQVVERHPWEDQFVYLQVTRGVARRDHAFPPASVPPTVFAMSSPFPQTSASVLENGVAAISLPDERWLHCDVKSTSLLGNVLAKQAAVDAGAVECLMFRDDRLTEGAAANVWLVRDGLVLAPPRDHLILEGIRYGLLEELCQAEGIGFEVRPLFRADVAAADELLLTSAIREVHPVTRLDGRPVGNGRPGPVFRRLHSAYQRAKADTIERARGRAEVSGS